MHKTHTRMKTKIFLLAVATTAFFACGGPAETQSDAAANDTAGEVAQEAEAETNAINRALMATAGNMSETARLLDISRPTIYNLIEKYNIETHTENEA